MEFSRTRRAERQGPSRVPGAVHPRPMGSPSASSGKGNRSRSTESHAQPRQRRRPRADRGSPGRECHQGYSAKRHASTHRHAPQWPCTQHGRGHGATSQGRRGWQGSNTRAQRALTPMQMYQVKVTHNQGRPTTTTRNEVVKKSVDGPRPVLDNWTKEPQAGKRQARDHAKFTTSSQHLSTSAAVPGGATVRHGHRTSVATDKCSLHARKLALSELVPCTD